MLSVYGIVASTSPWRMKKADRPVTHKCQAWPTLPGLAQRTRRSRLKALSLIYSY